MPAFAFRHIKDLYPVFWRKGQESVEAMSNEWAGLPNTEGFDLPKSVEVGGWASRATLDIIGLAGMGRDFNAIQDPNNELNQTYRNMFSPNKTARLLGIASIFLPRSNLTLDILRISVVSIWGKGDNPSWLSTSSSSWFPKFGHIATGPHRNCVDDVLRTSH